MLFKQSTVFKKNCGNYFTYYDSDIIKPNSQSMPMRLVWGWRTWGILHMVIWTIQYIQRSSYFQRLHYKVLFKFCSILANESARFILWWKILHMEAISRIQWRTIMSWEMALWSEKHTFCEVYSVSPPWAMSSVGLGIRGNLFFWRNQ